MSKLSQFALEFLKHEDGPTAVEYAVMLALIIVVCIAAISALGTNAKAPSTRSARRSTPPAAAAKPVGRDRHRPGDRPQASRGAERSAARLV